MGILLPGSGRKPTFFSPNFVSTEPQVAVLGKPVMGILAATYGAHLTTVGSLAFSSKEEWSDLAPAPLPRPRCIDLDPRAVGNIPMLGGCGFDLEATRWCLAGVRLKPTREEIHTHQAQQRQRGELEGADMDLRFPGHPLTAFKHR